MTVEATMQYYGAILTAAEAHCLLYNLIFFVYFGSLCADTGFWRIWCEFGSGDNGGRKIPGEVRSVSRLWIRTLILPAPAS